MRILVSTLFALSLAVTSVACGTASQENVSKNSSLESVPESADLSGEYSYVINLGTEENPSSCFGSLPLPHNFANSGLNEGLEKPAVLKVLSSEENQKIALSYTAIPGGSKNDQFEVGVTKKEGTLVKQTVAWVKSPDTDTPFLQIKIEGADLNSMIVFQKRVWHFSKVEGTNDLLVEYSSKINFHSETDTRSCILKNVK